MSSWHLAAAERGNLELKLKLIVDQEVVTVKIASRPTSARSRRVILTALMTRKQRPSSEALLELSFDGHTTRLLSKVDCVW